MLGGEQTKETWRRRNEEKETSQNISNDWTRGEVWGKLKYFKRRFLSEEVKDKPEYFKRQILSKDVRGNPKYCKRLVYTLH